MKQNQIFLNKFAKDLSVFIENYYSEEIEEVSIKSVDEWIKVQILALNKEDILEINTEGEEITVVFGESHWHINDYNDPVQLNNVYRATILSVFEVLDGKLITYSAWCGETALGGGSLVGTINEVQDNAKIHFKNADSLDIKLWNKEKLNIKIVQ